MNYIDKTSTGRYAAVGPPNRPRSSADLRKVRVGRLRRNSQLSTPKAYAADHRSPPVEDCPKEEYKKPTPLKSDV